MRKKIGVDKETAVCRIVAEEKHPNKKKKRLHRYVINPDKLKDTISTIEEGKIPLKDLSRSILMSPTKADDAWFGTYIFDVDYPNDNLDSPKSQILEILYIDEMTRKKKVLEVYFDSYIAELGYIYWFSVLDKDDAECLHPYVEKFFLDEEIRIFGAEYRDANDHAWKPLDDNKGKGSLDDIEFF